MARKRSSRCTGVRERPLRLLWDTEDPAIVYVFRGERAGKVIVRVLTKGAARAEINSVVTAGYLHHRHLQPPRYVPIGEVSDE